MEQENITTLSSDQQEFLRMARERLERRHNDTINSTNKNTSDTKSVGTNLQEDEGSRGSGKRNLAYSYNDEEEDTEKLIEQAKQKSKRKSKQTQSSESSTSEESTEEHYKDEELSDNTLNENPLETTRNTKEENFKNIRNALKASRNRVSELETELKAKEEELQKLDTVTELEAKLEEANSKLEKLQKYEDIVGLYGTEGFKEEYYDKVDSIKSNIMNLANDYNVSEDVINRALTITNQRQLNEYLGQYFDVYSVQDIRKDIKEIQDIVSKREEAERNPVQTREYLLTNFAKKRDAMDKQSRENIKLASMSAWTEMSETYSNPQSGVAILQEKRGDSEHNETRMGILNNSSQEFGKLVAVLADNGLRSLPSNVARALASRFQLGETAAYAIVQSENLKKENDELRAELRKFTDYQRPLSNAGSGAISGKNLGTQELKGKELTRYLFNRASGVN